jgi:hypothetical protein
VALKAKQAVVARAMIALGSREAGEHRHGGVDQLDDLSLAPPAKAHFGKGGKFPLNGGCLRHWCAFSPLSPD